MVDKTLVGIGFFRQFAVTDGFGEELPGGGIGEMMEIRFLDVRG